ncbi:MAG: hypothetical protein RLZZ628_4120 [Bacteroidota bacterium]|jgi:hypothetical protein
MTIELLKYAIIQEVTLFKSEWALLKLKEILKELAQEEAQKQLLFKPTRKKLILAELKEEQNYKGANRAVLNYAIAQMDIKEPIETLLAQLTP